MDSEVVSRSEETIRLLAAAAGAARLYPRSSALPAEAVARFVERSNQIASAAGPVRFIVDPHGFRGGDEEIAAHGQVVALAESLHAMQVGQLIVAPGVTAEETWAFLDVANADPAEVRTHGGARTLLVRAGVQHLAVIEVSLRASEEEGLLGVDITNAPLDDIAAELPGAAERWAREAKTGPGTDDVAAAVGRLEQATRDIAADRVAAALMRLDEQTRMKVLGWALHADANGKRMDGMLSVIARMKPASLARLLKLVAEQAGTDPQRIAAALPSLPPETAHLLEMLLAPTPDLEPDFGLSSTEQAAEVAAALETIEEPGDLERQIAMAAPQLAAGRALATAVSVSRAHADIDSVHAIRDALPDAARDGAFVAVREALRRLDELAADPMLADAATNARAALQDREMLRAVCASAMTDADAAIAGEILHAAGTLGAEALIEAYIDGSEQTRSLMRPVLRGMNEVILGIAGRRLRTEDAETARKLLEMLPALGDRRVVPTLQQALGHLDAGVRRATVSALADTPGPEARAALIKAVAHWDPATGRFAVREIGRVHAAEAIPTLVRQLEDINPLQRSHELKKEIVMSLEAIGSPDALPALRRVAGRKFAFGSKNKELRHLAQQAVAHLERASGGPTRGVDAS